MDDQNLQQKYDVVRFHIASGTQISTRTSTVTSRLSNVPSEDGKLVVVALTAQAKVASKLISIVEIAKRDLTSRGVQCYQYNALKSEMIEIDRKPKHKANGLGTDQALHDRDESDESDHAFETIGEREDVGKKKRAVPVMTVYLSRESVKELRQAHGYVLPFQCFSWVFRTDPATASRGPKLPWPMIQRDGS